MLLEVLLRRVTVLSRRTRFLNPQRVCCLNRKLLSYINIMRKGRQLLLLSSSKVHGSEYLQFAAQDINCFLKKFGVTRILFIPYALRDYDGYTEKIYTAFKELGYEVEGIHKAEDPVLAVNNAQAMFIGGGNTFQLLKALYDNKLIEPIRKQVLENGTPYIGSSAGTNVATVNICTTNDMPIVYPPSFSALKLVPFNINPHYIDTDPKSTHLGETREERITQYQEIPGVPKVLALREGCILHVEEDKATLKGLFNARLFTPGKKPEELEVGSDVSFLLNTEGNPHCEKRKVCDKMTN